MSDSAMLTPADSIPISPKWQNPCLHEPMLLSLMQGWAKSRFPGFRDIHVPAKLSYSRESEGKLLTVRISCIVITFSIRI